MPSPFPCRGNQGTERSGRLPQGQLELLSEPEEENTGSGEGCHFRELTELSEIWDSCLLTLSQALLLPCSTGRHREARKTQLEKSAGTE